jgi:hypothetical protein
MAVNLSVTEVRGRIDANGRLSVDESFPVQGPVPVRVWVMREMGDEELDEKLWMAALASNPAFADLNDPAEDIYTLNDGQPFKP